MANYYHEARKQVQALKKTTEDNRRRAERRQELAIIDAETSISSLRVDGRPSKLTRSHDAYLAAEARDGMIPWNGDGENLIDRFDGRALLDMYIDPDPRAKRQKSDGELELEELVRFEAFRDLVKLLQLGVAEEAGILLAEDENLDARAAAKSSAAAQAAVTGGQAAGPKAPGVSAGMGQYGAVGFSYAGAEGSGSEEGYSGSEGGSGEDEESEGEEPGGEGEEADGLAANLGIDSFSVLLRRAEREEEAEATGAANANRKRKFSRKNAAQRARRMIGQGLGHLVQRAPADSFKPASGQLLRGEGSYGARRGSPSYDAYRDGSRSRSRSPGRRRGERGPPKPEFITEFKAPKARGSGGAGSSALPYSASIRDGAFVDALPQGGAPAAGQDGPVGLPAHATRMQGVRASDMYFGRDEERRRERERERRRDGAPVKPPPTAQTPAAAPAAPKEKETPMERLKRLRAAQINRAFQKEALGTAQKRLAEERDRRARETLERAALRTAQRARSPSPPSPPRSRSRYRSRSRSPRRRYRSRSRS